MKLTVLVPKISNRLRYAFDLLLNNQLGLQYDLTVDAERLLAAEGLHLVYGKEPIQGQPFQKAVNLLFEYNIVEQEEKPFDYQGVKGIFPVYHPDSIMPFDVFAASFYLVTRYEEYLPQIRDKYGRFQAEYTCMHAMGMLQKPLVNIWANALGNILTGICPTLKLKKKSFKFVPTYDIDAAWAYRHKGLYRTIGAYARDIIARDYQEVKHRNDVLFHGARDPFDTYDLQFELQNTYKLRPIYFILCGDYDQNDKNISVRNDAFRNLIKQIGDYADVGIHPSFSSYLDSARLQQEIERLSSVLNRELTKSRQHFLRMTMPRSYQKIIELDITDDYTMGFASQPGFRAGIADTYRFFDLENDVVTNLNIHPFTVMDGTLRDYLNLNVDESYRMITSLIDEVKAVNGTFIFLCHNETLGGEKRWKGWPEMYRNILEYATK